LTAPRISGQVGRELAVMGTTNGKLRLVLSSKRVLARVEEFQSSGVSSSSLMAFNGQLLSSRRRVPVYEYVLDEEQSRALRAAREIASQSGLVLEETDLSRQSPLKRLLRVGMSRMTHESLSRYRMTPSPQTEEPATRSRAFRP